jgi:hypothetical protein
VLGHFDHREKGEGARARATLVEAPVADGWTGEQTRTGWDFEAGAGYMLQPTLSFIVDVSGVGLQVPKLRGGRP